MVRLLLVVFLWLLRGVCSLPSAGPWLWRFSSLGCPLLPGSVFSLAFFRSRLSLVGFRAPVSCLPSSWGFVALPHALPYFGVVGFLLFRFLQAVSCFAFSDVHTCQLIAFSDVKKKKETQSPNNQFRQPSQKSHSFYVA